MMGKVTMQTRETELEKHSKEIYYYNENVTTRYVCIVEVRPTCHCQQCMAKIETWVFL